MRNYLEQLDQKSLRIVKAIGKMADGLGVNAYIVGGIVRDLILRKSNFDLDILIDGDAINLAKKLSRPWKAKLTVHHEFGTASLQLPSGKIIDFATVRSETYQVPGALPIVKKGSFNDDLSRRDFTINALALSINKKTFGTIVDLFEGLKDLRVGKIRVFHEKSFCDDPTRILRAIRFEQRFSFSLERATGVLLKVAIVKRYDRFVNPKRYFSEFRKILKEENPVKTIKRLRDLKALGFLELKRGINLASMNQVYKGVIRLRKEQVPFSPLLYLGSILEGQAPKDLEHFFKKFGIPKEEKNVLIDIQKTKKILKVLSRKSLSRSQVYEVLIELKEPSLQYLLVRSDNKIVHQRIIEFLMKTKHVALRITGYDLKKRGMIGGKRMGRILKQVLYAKIDKKVATKAQELTLAGELK